MMSGLMPTYAALIAGVLILTLVLQDAFEVMLLPRRVQRRLRMVRLYFRGAWALWTAAALVWPAGGRRERFLSIFGALSMMLLFAMWAASLIFAFALLQWWAQHIGAHAPVSPLSEQAYMSGATFFTLGYGDVVPHTGVARVLAVVEAGVGFGLMAVVIGYLPVLYQLFSRREAHVLQLDARAGSPPTATSMLVRHAESDGLDSLDDILRAWELWSADLLESHLSYPMLAYYRSQHADQSWLGALAALMDTCALVLIGVEDVKPLQARMTFAMARQVVVEMARSLEVVGVQDIGQPRLGPTDYPAMMESFANAGLTWTGGPDGEETLASVRATYEPLLQGLAAYLLIPLPGWLPETSSSDHWERGPRGIIARRLIGGLAAGSISGSRKPGRRKATRAERLRDQLK
jgi:voltage-gated potassium channel Kch